MGCLVKHLFSFSVALMLLPLAAGAQRTVSSRGFAGLGVEYPWGGGIYYGQYLPSSFWEAGAGVLWRNKTFEGGIGLDYMQALASGGWMYRLVATRNRLFNLYAGAGAFLGYEFYDPMKKLPSYVRSEQLSTGTFLYGLHAKLQIQIYICRQLSLTLSGLAPVNFSSPVGLFQPGGSLGVRLDL